MPVFTGVIAGYLAYDCLHYLLHHSTGSLCWAPFISRLRRTHLCHHYRDQQHSFGISSPLVDLLLGSLAPAAASSAAADSNTAALQQRTPSSRKGHVPGSRPAQTLGVGCRS